MYYFFFSYAHVDLKRGYLSKFFADLKDEVDALVTEGEPSFRDIDNIAPGDDWKDELKEALQTSRTLVCVFSNKYFSREWCGKEFQVFLDRQPQVEIVDGVARGSSKIIPLLWNDSEDLRENDLPPLIARSIQYMFGPDNGGFRSHIRNNNGSNTSEYWEAVERIAREIVDRSRDNPLPPMDEMPSLDSTPNAFAQVDPPEDAAIEGPDTVVVIYPWMDDAVSVLEWKPFPEIRPVLFSLNELIEEKSLNPVTKDAQQFDAAYKADIEGALAEASQKNALVIFVINSGFLANEQFAKNVERIIEDEEWHGGMLFLAPGDQRNLVSRFRSRVEHALEEHNNPERQDQLDIRYVSTAAQLRLEFESMHTQLLGIVSHWGQVKQIADGEGPHEKPLVSGPSN